MTQVLLIVGAVLALVVLLTLVATLLVSVVAVGVSLVEIARNPQLAFISFRSLLQHRRRTSVVALAVGLVTALLIAVTGISVGIHDTLLTSATTLMSGHLNVAGFYKPTASQSAPVVTGYKKISELVKRDFPEVDFTVQRGRGWAKLISDTGSMQVGIGGIDITQEPGFRSVVVLREGSLDGLTRPDSILIFEEQAEKLGAKVGDRMTISAPTARGTNNTIDVTVVAVAASVGMLSTWNTFVNGQGLRQLYQLNDETTGALQLYLKDLRQLKVVQEKLRGALTKAGYELLEPDPRPFWMKFESVNGASWTGQKLDVTNWEDESSFVQWMVKSFSALATGVIFILVIIIAVGIMNVVWISIRERTREIGTLRAVGMQRRSVLAMFVAEGFLLGLTGTVSGALGGLAISAGLNAAHIQLPKSAQFVFMSDHLIVTPTVGWLAFGVFFITGIITAISVLPSFLAARLKPISAMSHVG